MVNRFIGMKYWYMLLILLNVGIIHHIVSVHIYNIYHNNLISIGYKLYRPKLMFFFLIISDNFYIMLLKSS